MKGSRFYCILIAALMLSLWFGIFSAQEAYSKHASSHSSGIYTAISCVLSAETPNIYGTKIRAEGRMDCNSAEAVKQVYVDVQLQRLDAKTSQWVKEGEKQGSKVVAHSRMLWYNESLTRKVRGRKSGGNDHNTLLPLRK